MRSTEVGPRRFTLNKVRAQARLVDLTTAVVYEAFLHAGTRALAVGLGSMVAVLMAAEGVVDRTQKL
jgi:hypothetical protein